MLGRRLLFRGGVKEESPDASSGTCFLFQSGSCLELLKRSKEKKIFMRLARVGRQVGVFLTWEECQRSVSGYSSAEFKSFSTMQEAEAYLKGPRTRRCYVKLTAPGQSARKPRPASFIAGRALKATIKVLQEGETRPLPVRGCLDSRFRIGC